MSFLNRKIKTKPWTQKNFVRKIFKTESSQYMTMSPKGEKFSIKIRKNWMIFKKFWHISYPFRPCRFWSLICQVFYLYFLSICCKEIFIWFFIVYFCNLYPNFPMNLFCESQFFKKARVNRHVRRPSESDLKGGNGGNGRLSFFGEK
jgi:hypothetical protein